MTNALATDILSLAQRWDSSAKSARPLLGGRINQTWRIETSGEPLVVRIYPKTRREKQVRFELSIMNHLVKTGAPIPFPKAQASGNILDRLEGALAICVSYLDAEPISDEAAPSVPIADLAALLCPIREALESMTAPFRPARETRIFEQRMPALLAQLPAKDAARARDLFERLKHFEEESELVSSIVHADIHPGNVLCSDKGVIHLIDFDDAHVGMRAIDWILPALDFSWRGDGTVDEARYEALLEALIDGRASDPERQALSTLRTLVTLKSAASVADCQTPLSENIYVPELSRRLALEV